MKKVKKISKSVGVGTNLLLLTLVLIYLGDKLVDINLRFFDHWGYFSAILSLIIMDLFILRIYDFWRIDFFGFEEFKKNEENLDLIVVKNKFVKKIILWKKKGNKFLLLMFILWNSTLTVLYYRKGNFLFNGIKEGKTFLLFIISALVCNTKFVLAEYIKNLILKYMSLKDILILIAAICLSICIILIFIKMIRISLKEQKAKKKIEENNKFWFYIKNNRKLLDL